MIEWYSLDTVQQLDEIQQDSFSQTQAIFKHSTTCPISAMAKRRIESSWDIENIKVYYLDLLAHRSVSNAIADKWNVVHESPQIILIKDGAAIYNESHLDISLDRIASANV